jgi:phosphatidylserine decarboxylase
VHGPPLPRSSLRHLPPAGGGGGAVRDELLIYNRYSRAVEREPVCGEWFLRFAYGSFLGRCLQASIGSRIFFSRIASLFTRGRLSRRKILPFVRRYAIAADDCDLPLDRYVSFQEFFSRRLRPGARPVDGSRGAICAPADGRHLYIPQLPQREPIAVKGRHLRLDELLGSRSLAAKFEGGSALICRLAPFDYHRFHFPCDGVPSRAVPLGSGLHGVHPLALRSVAALSRNRRYLTRIVADCGEVAMVEVGATFVGSVRQTFAPHRHAKKGEEKGYFAFGGSTVILLFERGAVLPSADLAAWSLKGVETYARMGDRLLERA